MKTFTYNDMLFSVEPADGKWNIVCQRNDQRTAYVATGVFAGVADAEIDGRAQALVKKIFPVGVRLVGPKPQWARQDGGEAGLHPSNVHDCEYAIGAINFTGDFPVRVRYPLITSSIL